MNNLIYKRIIQNIPYGYSCHKLAVNDNGNLEFEFVEINKAFAEYTGLNNLQTIGKTISSVQPRIFGKEINWEYLFKKVKIDKFIDTELYVETKNQFYKVVIMSEDEYIITHIMPQHKGSCPFTEQQCFARMDIVPIIMIDKEGKLYRANNQWSKEFGYIYLDKNKLFTDYIYTDDRKQAQEKLLSITEDESVKFDCRLICDDNNFKETEIYAAKRENYIYILVRDRTDEKILERKLKSSNENFEAFFMAIDDLAFVGDYNGNIMYANNAVQNKLGYSLKETLNMNILDFHPDEVRQEAMEVLDDMFNNKRDVCPLPVKKKDGTYVPAETRVWFGQWDNKNCIFSLSKDLGKEQESLQRLLKIFKEFPANVIIREFPSLKYVNANKNFFRNFGYTEEELIEIPPMELNVFSDEECFLAAIEELKTDGFIKPRQMNFTTKTGNIINGMLSGNIIESQGKKYFLSFIIDITKQMEYESELIYKGELQQLLVKLSSKFINHPLENIDDDINKSLEELGEFVGADRVYIFDYDLEKGTTSNTYEWCNEGISPEIDNLQNISIYSIPDWFNTHIKGETIIIPDVFALDGTVSEVKNILIEQNVKSLITIPMMEGKVCVGYVGFDSVRHYRSYSQEKIELLFVYAQILVNLQMRKKQEDMLNESRLKAQEASDVKSNFIAQISHELRTPLNGAFGFLELLSDSVTMTRQINYINKAKISINTMLKLADDLKDISKIEENKLEVISEKLNIRKLINDAVTPFAIDIGKKRINLYINVDADVPINMYGDSERIKQIISNLVSNSIKHTEVGSITISCRVESIMAEKIKLLFDVKDTGKGIIKQDLPYIFKPFFQNKNSKNGMGIGLAICKELISKMNGSIWVESEPNMGTIFYFTIILSMNSQQLSLPDTVKYTNVCFNGIRVLLAEDNEINQELAKEILSSRNIIVDTVFNGAEAIKAFKQNEYDVILMDIQMPVMDGLEAAKIIREGDLKSDIPIIAMTASVMQGDKEFILSSGFNGIVEKPIHKDLLFQEIYIWTKGKSSYKNSTVAKYDDIDVYTHEDIFYEEEELYDAKLKNHTTSFIEELSKCLKENNVDALELIKAAVQNKSLSDYSNQIKLIENYINKYDFLNALKELDKLNEQLKLNRGE